MKVIDTSVLAEIDRGNNPEKIEKLDAEGKHVISIVSVTEMFLGVEKLYSGKENYEEKRNELNDFLSRFKVKRIDWPIATASAEIIQDLKNRGQPLDDLHDIYIAATAKSQDKPVLTANPSHFERIEGIEVERWEDY